MRRVAIWIIERMRNRITNRPEARRDCRPHRKSPADGQRRSSDRKIKSDRERSVLIRLVKRLGGFLVHTRLSVGRTRQPLKWITSFNEASLCALVNSSLLPSFVINDRLSLLNFVVPSFSLSSIFFFRFCINFPLFVLSFFLFFPSFCYNLLSFILTFFPF